MDKLLSNPVFIDTSIFYQNNFNFSSKQFKQLTELSRKCMIKIVITEITKREILKHINDLSIEAEKGFEKFKRKNRLVRLFFGDEFKKMGEGIKKEYIFNKCKEAFDHWLIDADVIILPIHHSDPTEVFDLYFSDRHPFKFKKNEFPDAFSLSIVCNQYKNLSIISLDKDMLSFKHDRISQHYSSLSSYIDHMLQSNNSEYELIIKEYNVQKDRILDSIKEGFSTFDFLSKNGLYTDAVNISELSVAEEKVVEIENRSATIVISVIIHYEIMVYYKEIENYKLEKDFHNMEIEILFEFGEKSVANQFDYIKIESIMPKESEDTIVMIHEEEFS